MTPTPQAIENAARAMWMSEKWSSFWSEDDARALAGACLSADLGGMVLVPKEATDAACEAARSFDEAAGGKSYEYREMYRIMLRAMIAAAEDTPCK